MGCKIDHMQQQQQKKPDFFFSISFRLAPQNWICIFFLSILYILVGVREKLRGHNPGPPL